MYKWTVFIFFWIMAGANAQNNRTGPVAVEYDLIRGVADSALVIVRQEYKLISPTDEYVWGDNDYFGKGYSLGCISGNQIWVEKESLTPWKTDTLYRRFAHLDTLVPALRNTYIRPLWDTSFAQITVIGIDTFVNGAAALQIPQFPFQLPARMPADTALGLAVVVQPVQDIRKNEKTPLKIIVLQGTVEKNTSTGEWSFPSGTIVTPPLGSIFLTWKNQTGMMKLYFGGLLKRSLLNFKLIPVTTGTQESEKLPEAEPPPPDPPLPANQTPESENPPNSDDPGGLRPEGIHKGVTVPTTPVIPETAPAAHKKQVKKKEKE